MGTNLFGIDLKSLFASAMGSQLVDMTLKKRVPGTTYDVNDPAAGPRYSETTHACKGAITVKEFYKDTGDTIRIKSGEAVVLLGTIAAGVRPEPSDVLTVTIPGTTVTQDVTVVSGTYDPAGASAQLIVAG